MSSQLEGISVLLASKVTLTYLFHKWIICIQVYYINYIISVIGFKLDKSILTNIEKERLSEGIDLLEVPKLSDLALNFSNEEELEDYVTGRDYILGKTILFSITINSYLFSLIVSKKI